MHCHLSVTWKNYPSLIWHHKNFPSRTVIYPSPERIREQSSPRPRPLVVKVVQPYRHVVFTVDKLPEECQTSRRNVHPHRLSLDTNWMTPPHVTSAVFGSKGGVSRVVMRRGGGRWRRLVGAPKSIIRHLSDTWKNYLSRTVIHPSPERIICHLSDAWRNYPSLHRHLSATWKNHPSLIQHQTENEKEF